MNNSKKINEISEEEIKNAIASFDPLKGYNRDAFIDIYDKSTWRVGIIMQAENNVIEVHFEGWSSKHDEKNVKVTDSKVAPFRKYTKGYTGQKSSSYRPFTYSHEVKVKLERELKELREKSFVVEDVYKFNQFFRGELFFFVDSLLTSLAVSPPAPELIPEVLEFLELYLSVIVEWLGLSWELREELEAGEKWELLYAVHGRTALAMSQSDLAETLCKVFGGSVRTPITFALLYDNRKGVASDDPIDMKKATEWVVGHFYKKFKELGGLDEILRMVKE